MTRRGEMTMNNRLARVTALLLGAIILPGCQQPTGEPTLLESRSQFYVFDIPVPKGFQRDRRKSSYNVSAGDRAVKDFYVGSDSPLAVNNFYRQTMPENQWMLQDEQLQNAVYLLKYTKGDEKCEVRIEETAAGWLGGKTRICVTVRSTP